MGGYKGQIMNSPQKPHAGSIHSRFDRITQTQLLKELLFVCIWIGFGTLTLWGGDIFGFLSFSHNTPTNTTLQVEFPHVYDIWKRGEGVFVDTRPATYFKRGHIPGAVNVPINRVTQHLNVLPTNKETPLITYCGSIACPNSYQLMHVLLGEGYLNVRYFPRGLKGWQTLGYPLETE